MPRSFLIKKNERKLSDHVAKVLAKSELSLHVHQPMLSATSVYNRTSDDDLPSLTACFNDAGYEHDLLSSHHHISRVSESRPASDGESEPSTGGEEDDDRVHHPSNDTPAALDTFHRFNFKAFQSGVTTGYTYDTFFVKDGRSRRHSNPHRQDVVIGETPLPVLPLKPEEKRQRYACSECGKHYATSSNLSRHKQTHRSLESKLAKKCGRCGKVYVSMPALAMHLLTHELRHRCPVCDKPFSRPWLLQGHMRSHTGEKPYGCAHCGKAFADRSNLRAHMQTHSMYKHYRCRRCDKSFALKSYLNKHYESACFKDQLSATDVISDGISVGTPSGTTDVVDTCFDTYIAHNSDSDDDDIKIDVIG